MRSRPLRGRTAAAPVMATGTIGVRVLMAMTNAPVLNGSTWAAGAIPPSGKITSSRFGSPVDSSLTRRRLAAALLRSMGTVPSARMAEPRSGMRNSSAAATNLASGRATSIAAMSIGLVWLGTSTYERDGSSWFEPVTSIRIPHHRATRRMAATASRRPAPRRIRSTIATIGSTTSNEVMTMRRFSCDRIMVVAPGRATRGAWVSDPEREAAWLDEPTWSVRPASPS